MFLKVTLGIVITVQKDTDRKVRVGSGIDGAGKGQLGVTLADSMSVLCKPVVQTMFDFTIGEEAICSLNIIQKVIGAAQGHCISGAGARHWSGFL